MEENDKGLKDWSFGPNDEVMEDGQIVTRVRVLSDDGKEKAGTSDPIEIEDDATIDDVILTNEDLTFNEPKEKKRKNGRQPKKVEPKEKKQSKRKPAPCWDHFDKIQIDGVQWARCKYCEKEYAADSKMHGVTNLNSHTPNCPKYPNRDQHGQPNLVFKREGDGVEVVSSVFSQSDCKRALARMVIVDELPFRFVEGVGFRDFCLVMQPKFEKVSRQTITREVVALSKVEKAKLMKQLEGRRICITTDTWTSIQNFNYMCLTAHFIDDDWNLQKRILNFCQVEDHKGVTVGKKIENLLLDWGVGGIFTVTVDNASSNSVALQYLAKRTKNWKRTILENKHMHMRCASHILNLNVVEGLKEQNQSIRRVRDVVRYVRSSPQRLETFKKCAESEKIESKQTVCLDVSTRWNSTYLMLEVANKFERVFTRMAEDDANFINYFVECGVGEEWSDTLSCMVDSDIGGGGHRQRLPTAEDWKNCEMFVNFLKLFYDATKQFSGSLYVTSNTFFEYMARIEMEIDMLSGKDDDLLVLMAKNMKQKFEKYWDIDNVNVLLYVAATLDPRHKLKWLRFWFSTCKGKVVADEMERRVKEVLHDLYNDYKDKEDETSQMPSAKPKETVGEQSSAHGDAYKKLSMMYKAFLEVEQSSAHSSEVDKYLADGYVSEDDLGFEILGWWKTNAYKYPILALVARDVLAMPVSTVSSESAFSTGGRVLDPFRSSLKPSMVETLVCTQNWLLSNVPISIRQSLDKVEEFERDILANDDDSTSCVTVE